MDRFWFSRRSPLRVTVLGCALSAFFCGVSIGQITPVVDPSATPVHIRITRPKTPQAIPDTVFGSFLEPIGHATYGGVWADVIENPSFEEGLWSPENVTKMLRDRPELGHASHVGLPLPWEPLHTDDGSRYLPVRGDAANSAQSVLIMSLPAKEIGIRQRIYLPTQRELTYNGSLWIKHVRGGASIQVALRRHDHPDEILATSTLQAGTGEWTKYPFTLTLKQGQLAPLEPVDLSISLQDDARAMVDQVALQPADNLSGLDPDMVHMLQDLHSPLVRFGGNFTSAYDFKDGLGPPDKRVSKLNFSWGIPEYNTFGTDEFLRLCELVHAQPQIALNLGTGTPDQAAAWVSYVNQHWADHKGGLLWELGNELWGNFQIGFPSQQKIAALTLSVSEAVHKVDPTARLIATGADPDHFKSWNEAQLGNPPGTFQYLSTHFVVTAEVLLPNAPADFRTMASLALPIALGRQMHAIHDQIEATPHKGVKTAFTEWLMVGRNGAPNFTNMGGALFTAGLLNMVLRESAIVPISDMTGNVEFGGIWKKRGQVYGTPAYWVLREYATAAPRTLLNVQSDGPMYTVSQGVRRLPEIADVPYLDVTAAESTDKKHLLLFCVNRSLKTTASATFDLKDLSLKPNTMQITTLNAEETTSENNEEKPNLIKPIVQTEKVTSNVSHTFPAASVTILQLPLSR